MDRLSARVARLNSFANSTAQSSNLGIVSCLSGSTFEDEHNNLQNVIVGIS
jgi:hypothetical protein